MCYTIIWIFLFSIGHEGLTVSLPSVSWPEGIQVLLFVTCSLLHSLALRYTDLGQLTDNSFGGQVGYHMLEEKGIVYFISYLSFRKYFTLPYYTGDFLLCCLLLLLVKLHFHHKLK